MCRLKEHGRRYIELLTGELADRLEVEYAKAEPRERGSARDRWVEEKAKHRITSAATLLVTAAVGLLLDKLLPEA